MLSEKEATEVVSKGLPDGDIQWVISYRDVYLFQVFFPSDPLEGDQDPFFSVDKKTGELRDFSVLTDGNVNEISDLVREKKNQR